MMIMMENKTHFTRPWLDRSQPIDAIYWAIIRFQLRKIRDHKNKFILIRDYIWHESKKFKTDKGENKKNLLKDFIVKAASNFFCCNLNSSSRTRKNAITVMGKNYSHYWAAGLKTIFINFDYFCLKIKSKFLR